MAGSGNNKQDDNFFLALSGIIAKRFPTLPIEQLEIAIEKGVCGEYDTEAYIPITSATIIRWVKKRRLEYIGEENKKIQDLPNYNELMWSGKIEQNRETGIFEFVNPK